MRDLSLVAAAIQDRYEGGYDAAVSGCIPIESGHGQAAVGSRDGREVSLALDELRNEGVLARRDNGEWALETKESRPAE
jgi:hypothetical protein